MLVEICAGTPSTFCGWNVHFLTVVSAASSIAFFHRTIRLRFFYASIAPDHDVDSACLFSGGFLLNLGPLNFGLSTRNVLASSRSDFP